MSETQEIIATLDTIIAMQYRMMERIEGMEKKMDEMIDEISSEKLNNEAVASMRTYNGPR